MRYHTLSSATVATNVNPEHQVGVHVTRTMIHPHVLDYIALGDDDYVVDSKVPEQFYESAGELQLQERHGIEVLAFKRGGSVSLHDSTTLPVVGLMFIGGGSTSNAGGIKVGSFMVLAIVTWGFLPKSNSPSAFASYDPYGGRSQGPSFGFISSSIVVPATFALTVAQTQPCLDLLFETVSALATPGLSRGTTGVRTDRWLSLPTDRSRPTVHAPRAHQALPPRRPNAQPAPRRAAYEPATLLLQTGLISAACLPFGPCLISKLTF